MNTSYEINAIIDNLCEKFGTAKEAFVPELARMCSIRYLVNSVFCVVAFIAIAMIICRCKKIMNDHQNHSYDTVQNAEIGVFVCSIALVGCFIALWCNVYECIQWFAAPTAKTIEYVLRLL